MSNFLDYICDPSGTLRWRIGVFSLYYVALATGVLIMVFLATISQILRLRRALYHSILYQEIGWFDSVETGVFSARLVEKVDKIIISWVWPLRIKLNACLD